MKQYIFSLIFVALSVFSFAQSASFEMEFEGEKVMATQNIDEKFLGTYRQDQGARQYQYSIKNEGSFYLAKNNEGWNSDNKQAIEWGVMTQDGQIVKAKLTDFDGSETTTYEAMILLVRDVQTSKYTYYNLYEHNGNIYLDEASKLNEVAKNE